MNVWERVLDDITFDYMVEKTRDSKKSIDVFFNLVRTNHNDFLFVANIVDWKDLNQMEKSRNGISRMGKYNMNKYIILMDYLSDRVEKYGL
ncbi:hypothetical protein Q7A53_05935 [Halobacillus rhizosphaerae]|uniref:hypothetical protein n=1 Tax=Halobacillus rhizosphaerae TaxID=3064889 RepID=UPI00398B3F0D